MKQGSIIHRAVFLGIFPAIIVGLAVLFPDLFSSPGLPILAITLLILFTLQITLHSRLVKQDVALLVGNLDQIAKGNFEKETAQAHNPSFSEVRTAVDAMANEVKLKIDKLHDVSQRDTLTGMPNRACFQRNVERQLQQDKDNNSKSYLFFIDLDGFKAVNDNLGHNYGDKLLQIVADRLKLATRTDNLNDLGIFTAPASIARFGGDEFTIFLQDVESLAIAQKFAARIRRILSEPFEMGAHSTGLCGSIGIACSPADGDNYSDLLRSADTAMYHAKRSGRNCVQIYTTALDEEARKTSERERELRNALARGEFELHFQPLYDCRTLKISSAEALVRWNHPERGLILPGEFIPLAEKTNLIHNIGEWVVIEAIKRIADFTKEGRPLRISVNVSPSQLQQIEFIALVKATLERMEAPPHLLELEITEDVAMQDPELVADRLPRISKLGVSIAIDDFGTGYSNLASLIKLPFSRLKIDRSLLQDFTKRPDARILVQTIISMANGLGFHSVAEGVEDAEQLDLLTVMGCDVVQGYLLSRPVNLADFSALLSAEDSKEDVVNQEFTLSA